MKDVGINLIDVGKSTEAVVTCTEQVRKLRIEGKEPVALSGDFQLDKRALRPYT